MSKNTLVISALVILAALAGGLYYWHTLQNPSGTTVLNDSAATSPSGTDTSDAGLKQDTAAIDAQFSGMASDKAAVDASLNPSVN